MWMYVYPVLCICDYVYVNVCLYVWMSICMSACMFAKPHWETEVVPEPWYLFLEIKTEPSTQSIWKPIHLVFHSRTPLCVEQFSFGDINSFISKFLYFGIPPKNWLTFFLAHSCLVLLLQIILCDFSVILQNINLKWLLKK